MWTNCPKTSTLFLRNGKYFSTYAFRYFIFPFIVCQFPLSRLFCCIVQFMSWQFWPTRLFCCINLWFISSDRIRLSDNTILLWIRMSCCAVDFMFWQFQPNSIVFCILNSIVFCFVVFFYFLFWQFRPNSFAFCILNSIVFCFVVSFTSCFDSSGRLDYSVLLFCLRCDDSGRIRLFCCNFHLMFWQLRPNSTVRQYNIVPISNVLLYSWLYVLTVLA